MLKRVSITAAARKALESYLERIGPEGEIPSILMAADVDMSQATNAGPPSKAIGPYHWTVAFYSRKQIPQEAVTIIEGMEFFIDEIWHDRLEGATLDYVKGYFVVLDAD